MSMAKINFNGFLFNSNVKIKNKKDKLNKIKSKKNILQNNKSNEIDFSNMLVEAENETTNINNITDNNQIDKEIENLFKNIGLQGEQLKKDPSLENLDVYKKMVKSLITKVLSKSIIYEKKNIPRLNKQTFMKEDVIKIHLKSIDDALLELTQEFFEEQKRSNVINIAGQIDKIQGILVNLVY